MAFSSPLPQSRKKILDRELMLIFFFFFVFILSFWHVDVRAELKEASHSFRQGPSTTSDSGTTALGTQITNDSTPKLSKPVHGGPSAGSGGTLSIRIIEAEGLSAPPGINIPEIVQRAVVQNPKVGSLTVGSVVESCSKNADGRLNRAGSIQRKYTWWLPCELPVAYFSHAIYDL